MACNVGRGNEKGRVERPIGFVRSRFWPGRRFADLMDLNVQALHWRDDFANNRVHDETGKVPALVFEHEEKALLQPLPTTPFDTDDVEGQPVTKTFRVRFDRNRYSVPPNLVSQTVVVRANQDWVRVFLGPKQVAAHRRCWRVGEDIEQPAHREAALKLKPGASRDGLPPVLLTMGDVASRYFKIAAAGTKSLHRETVRLVFFVEVFGVAETADAMTEVMATGHVGADYVEYVLRHKKGLVPRAPAAPARPTRARRGLAARARPLALRRTRRRARHHHRVRGRVMKRDDELELLLEKLKWLRLPGMARALRGLLDKAAEENLSSATSSAASATRRRPVG